MAAALGVGESLCRRTVASVALLAVFILQADHHVMNVVNAQTTTQSAYLDPHNSARSAVGVAAVVWNSTVEAYAVNYAQSQTSSCSGGNLVHSGGPYGENLFWGSAGATWTPQDAVNDWVSEQAYYDYNSNSCASGHECGHYTQVVWSTTTDIGCASVSCSDASTYIICSYYPPGNYVGEKPY